MHKFWIKNWGKVLKSLSLYRSLSQKRVKFETFLDNLELIMWLTKIHIWWLLLVILMQNRTLGILMTARTALQKRAGQWPNTANLRPATPHIYHVMIIVTNGFSKKSFLLLLFFLEILLNDLELVFFEFKHFYKTHRTSLFICSFFTRCFIIVLCINAVHLFVLFHCM